jgi:S-adenosylhomocysteine hydrolase
MGMHRLRKMTEKNVLKYFVFSSNDIIIKLWNFDNIYGIRQATINDILRKGNFYHDSRDKFCYC